MPFDADNLDLRPRLPESSDRLSGWRDVAAYVGRSARTAQRWEKIFNLPVHRITTPNGEVVYAFRTELDAWLRDRDQKVSSTANSGRDPASPGGRRLLLLGSAIGVAVSLLTIAVVFLAVPFALRTARTLSTAAGPRSSDPGGWRVEDGRLKVYDARNQRLWEYRFPFALDEHAYARDRATASLVAIADLENDGAKEVVFIARGADAADSALFCFDANGAIRFVVQPRHRVRYGDQDYAPPFEAQRISLTQESDRSYSLWLVAGHPAWFPTVLEKITHTGDVAAEYWNDGRIDLLREARVGSHRVMLAAGSNIEYAGPSLTVLDYDSPGGCAPADDARFRCTSCADRAPIAAIVVPFTSLWSEVNLVPAIDDILLARNGYITLALHGNRITENGHARRDILTTFDDRFDVLDVQATEITGAESLRTTSSGQPGRQARRQMFPILRWLDGRRVPVARQDDARPAR